MRALGRRLGDAIEPGCAPWMTAQEPRERHPGAGPQPVAVERLVRVLGAGRKVTAMETDKRRERIAVDLHEAAAGEARGAQQVHAFGPLPFVFSLVAAPDGKPVSTFPSAAPRLDSIWLIASTTASNVRSVEA